MALQKQSKKLVFSQGIDTKTAPEITPMGKLHSAENVRFYQAGKLAKKKGSTRFATTKESTTGDPASAANIGTVNSSFVHQNGLCVITANNVADGDSESRTNGTPESIYNYSPTTQKWNFVSKAAFCLASSKVYPIVDVGGTNNLMKAGSSYTSSVIYNGILYAINYLAFSGTSSYYTAIDLATNEVLITVPITSVSRPRIFQFGGKIYITFVTGTNINAYVINPAVGLKLTGSTITFIADLGTNIYDVLVAENGFFYLSYFTNANFVTTVQCTTLPSSGAVSFAHTVSFNEVAPSKCISIFGGATANNLIFVAFNRTGTGLRVITAPSTLTGATVATIEAQEYEALSGTHSIDRTTLDYCLVGEASVAGVGAGHFVKIFPFGASTGSPTGAIMYNMLLAAKVQSYNGWTYAIFVNIDAFEHTYYLCVLSQKSGTTDSTRYWHPVAKLLFGQAMMPTGIASNSFLPDFNYDGSGKMYAVLSKYITAALNATINADSFGVPSVCKFDFTSNEKYQTKALAGNTYFNGGFPTVYDGGCLFEASFLHSPFKPLSVAQSTVGGGPLTLLGTYQFCTVFEFIDGNGNRHLSAPSIPTDSFTLTGGNNQLTFNAYTPSLSCHQFVNLLIYRTTANGSIFYLDSSTTQTVTGGAISTTATNTDAAIISNEILYTTGGVVENQCPTATKALTVWKDRLWALTDDGVVFSKQVTDGFPPEFNPVFNINATVNKSSPIAIGALKDKLLVYFQDDIFYTTGDGPGDTGVGEFTPLELGSMGIGAVKSNAVVETKDENYFLSRDGWRKVTQALQVEYIGAEVQQYFNENTSVYYATYCDNLHEIRISDGTYVHCFDTFLQQWFTNTTWADKAGIMWTGINSTDKKFVRVRISDSVILYEDSSTFFDDSVFTPMLIRTGWIPVEEFLGFERLYKIILLGRYFTPHNLIVRVFYDFVPNVAEVFTFSSASGSFAAFTDANIFQNDSFVSSGYPLELAFKPARQKCQSFRIEITDSYVSGSGQSLEIVGMNILIGVKNVGAKFRDVATVVGAGGGGGGSSF